ncbi:MAG: PAS domain S-box-containing protein, partial [Clostridium sp.]
MRFKEGFNFIEVRFGGISMKTRSAKINNMFILLFICVFVVIFMNKLVENKYNINIITYVQESVPLTYEEKEWLKKNPIIYGADNNSPPLRYVDEETKQYKGTSIDIIQALSVELEVEIKYKPFIFKDAFTNLDKGQISMCDMFPSPDRSKKYLFSDPFYNLRGVILVPVENNKVRSYSDLSGLRVAVPNGDYAIEFLNSKNINVVYTYTQSIQEAVKLLVNGQVDSVVGDEPVVSYFINEMNIKDSYKIIDPPLYEKGVVLAVTKSNQTLVNILNKSILSIKKKNVTEKIQQKWFGISSPISSKGLSDEIIIYIGLASLLIFLIIYAMYYWNSRLKDEVKKQTEELYISKNDLQTTFDGLSYLMIVIDKNCTISNVNKAFCQFWGLRKDEAIGEKCELYKALICLNCNNCCNRQTFPGGIKEKYDISYNDRFFSVDTFPIEDKNKEIIKKLFVIKDVTDMKITEKQLLQADKMVAVGQLAAGVAHEIRNPLGLIRSYTYVLKGQIKEENERIKKCIHVIETSVDRASNIVDNLLNFSRMSNDTKGKVNIKEFTQGILNLEMKILELHNIILKQDYEDNMFYIVNIESLKHILINLITNAIDSMPDGGALFVKCSRFEGELVYEISDTGTGIKKKDLDNIFHPFFTTKPPGKGTGLGLYIV